MTSERKIQANRCNAQLSTGPRTVAGKLRSRRNAFRHGLAAQTVINVIENAEDYQTLESSLLADYEPRSAFESELVVRLASLLWRMRRATMIETGLLQIQSDVWREPRNSRRPAIPSEMLQKAPYLIEGAERRVRTAAQMPNGGDRVCPNANASRTDQSPTISADSSKAQADIAGAFFRAANLNNEVFERIGRYETILWRKITNTLFLLETIRREANPALLNS